MKGHHQRWIISRPLQQDDNQGPLQSICKVRNNTKATALHLMAAGGSKESVENLIAGGSDVNAKTVYGRTPFHYTAENGSTEALQPLIQKADDLGILAKVLNDKDNNGDNALHLACSSGNQKTVEALLQKATELSIEIDDPEYVCHMLNARNKRDNHPLHLADANNHPKIIECLIKEGADINLQNKDGNTPLHLAVQEYNRALVLHRDNQKPDPTDTIDNLLTAICQSKEAQDILNTLNKDNKTALFYAIMGGSVELVQMLLQAGASTSINTIFSKAILVRI